MNNPSNSILIADDDRYVRDDLTDVLGDNGYKLLYAATAKEAFEVVAAQRPDLILLDIRFPDCTDLSLLQRIRKEAPNSQIIILTSQVDNLSQVVDAIKMGAFDYVAKPFAGPELRNRIEKALALQRLNRNHERILSELEEKEGLQRLIGASTLMQKTRQHISKLAQTDGCVLVTGESGTGKELAARALHYLSKRKAEPFVVVNCAAVPDTLIESEFFGHRRGAFTGAIESSKGKFEAAGDGTIFLDEIGDMPIAQQAALLRVLEYRRFTPVGETKERECRARFVLATNQDLRSCIENKVFREDLYYRINVASVPMPALRNRPEDIRELVEYYATLLSSEMGRPRINVSHDVIDLFKRYDWPGNVRELKNVLEGAIMLLDYHQTDIKLDDLPVGLIADCTQSQPDVMPRELREKEDLLRVLRQFDGNQTQAARALGLHRNTIRARIRHFGISDIVTGKKNDDTQS